MKTIKIRRYRTVEVEYVDELTVNLEDLKKDYETLDDLLDNIDEAFDDYDYETTDDYWDEVNSVIDEDDVDQLIEAWNNEE